MRKISYTLFLIAALFYFRSIEQPAADARPAVTKAGIINASSHRTKGSALLTRANFDEVLRNLYSSIGLSSYGLGYDIFRLAMIGYYNLESEGALNDKGLLTVINFEQPSTEKRFYTIDLINKTVKYHTYVAHGRNTGENLAARFSNIPHSNQSSLGFYVTGETYVGSKGYSLRLDGKERAFNDKIRSRAVVIHAADYATEKWITRYGRLGRSQGCPALPPQLNREVIDLIKNKSAIFTYFPDNNYLNASKYLQLEELFAKLDARPLELRAARLQS